MKVINKETKEVYKFMINTNEFKYGSVSTDNQTAKIGDYLIIDSNDNLIESVKEDIFYDRYELISD